MLLLAVARNREMCVPDVLVDVHVGVKYQKWQIL